MKLEKDWPKPKFVNSLLIHVMTSIPECRDRKKLSPLGRFFEGIFLNPLHRNWCLLIFFVYFIIIETLKCFRKISSDDVETLGGRRW